MMHGNLSEQLGKYHLMLLGSSGLDCSVVDWVWDRRPEPPKSLRSKCLFFFRAYGFHSFIIESSPYVPTRLRCGW